MWATATFIVVVNVIILCTSCFTNIHRKYKRRLKNTRRRRRRYHQRNCQGAIDEDPPSPNPRSQQRVIRNIPVPPLPNVAPQQVADRCACGFPLTFIPQPLLHQQHSNFLHQLRPAEQYTFAQQPQSQNLNKPGQQPDSELPPPYEPPKYQPNEGLHEARVLLQGIDINQFTRPPPPPYDEHPQQRTPIQFQ
ncbi:hypothetical protein TNIN_299661 [Trichonephila inaurata madagascariensis]|uniref:Uncharacterized protein n=1 Tax=Trichonephila inaurata madagascariensis TaxID=2747483 RepID=A0A8X6YFU2_9ARAC|nr:hypothetical protein TNIN_299661 [Trichonephila inaurata madagascariensis]